MDEVIIVLRWHGIVFGFAIIALAFSLAMYYKKFLEAEEKNAKLKVLCEKVQEAATTDPLTGLYNRRELDQRLNEEIGRATRYGHDLQVMFIDLDEFKKVNDICGHAKGDDVLKEIASKLKQTVRRHDISARYGGDEFVLVLPEITTESAKNVGEKIIEMIENIEINGSINISASIGIRQFNHQYPTADLIKGADNAMYVAKNGGKGKVHVH